MKRNEKEWPKGDVPHVHLSARVVEAEDTKAAVTQKTVRLRRT